MLKKAVVLGSVITLGCVASAEAHSPYFKSGFMAGAHVGLSKGTGTFNSTYDTNNALLAQFATSATGKARETNALYGIMGGYRHLFNEGYTVGLDVSFSLMSNNDLKTRLVHTNGTFAFDNKLSRDFNAVPSINFGKIFCNRWHVALGLGLGISRFQQQITFDTNSSKSEKSSILPIELYLTLSKVHFYKNLLSLEYVCLYQRN